MKSRCRDRAHIHTRSLRPREARVFNFGEHERKTPCWKTLGWGWGDLRGLPSMCQGFTRTRREMELKVNNGWQHRTFFFFLSSLKCVASTQGDAMPRHGPALKTSPPSPISPNCDRPLQAQEEVHKSPQPPPLTSHRPKVPLHPSTTGQRLQVWGNLGGGWRAEVCDFSTELHSRLPELFLHFTFGFLVRRVSDYCKGKCINMERGGLPLRHTALLAPSGSFTGCLAVKATSLPWEFQL